MALIIRGDTVQVMRGRDKGKRGKVLALFPKRSLVLVEGMHLVVRHVKPRAGVPGGRVEVIKPIPQANVRVVDPTTQKPSRVGRVVTEGGKKLRVTKKGNTTLPEALKRGSK